MFPNFEDYVDYDAIDVFVAVKTLFESPFKTIFVDTYVALDLCHERKMKKLPCCLPTLYV